MGLEYITQPQVFLAPISAQQGIRGLIENYPLLTTFQSWTSTTNTPTTALNIGGSWTMLETPAMTGEVVPESFIVTVGGVTQASNSYRIFNYPIRKITFDTPVPAGITVNLTQLATHSPSSQRFNYLRADSALITNLTSTTVVFVTSFNVSENLSAFRVTDLIASNSLSAGAINTDLINAATILSANTNLYNLFLPVQGGTLSNNSSNPILTITQTGSGACLRVEDTISDTTPFVIDSEGKVGIGKETPVLTLDLETTNTNGASIVRVSEDTLPGSLLLGKTRGIPSAKTAVLAGDVLGQIVFQGFDTGGSINNAASIESLVASTVGLSSVPGSLVFKTNAATATTPAERMRIASGGNVGIGTSVPSERLTVMGNISAYSTDPTLLTLDRPSILNVSCAFKNNSGITYVGRPSNTNGNDIFSVGTSNNLLSNPFFFINSTGNVGIGTITPTAKLTIEHNDTSAAVRITQTGTGNVLVVEDDNTNPDLTPLVVNNVGQIISGATTALDDTAGLQLISTSPNAPNGSITLDYYDSSPSNNSRYRIRRARGTPSSPQVVQSGDQIGALSFQGYDGSSFRPTATIVAACDGTSGLGDMPGRLEIYTTADGSATLTERMRINSAGQVGIGTTTPNERLTISGNLSASGTIQAGGLSVPRKFATNITGSALSYTITHNLGTRDVIVSVYNTASPHNVILTTVAHTTTNTVTVEFNPAPGASTYQVVVIG